MERRFAIVQEVMVHECETTPVHLHLFTQSTPGLVTGGDGIQIALSEGFATSGFEFMTREGKARGTLQYDEHANGGLKLHTQDIEALYVSGDVAYVWGKLQAGGALQRFRLRLLDADEPPTEEDRYELTLADGYQAGQREPIQHGHIEIHR